MLNGVYMTDVRRIVGKMRFDSTAQNDRRERVEGGFPNIDCVLQKQRLIYLCRLVRSHHNPLMALLSARDRYNDLLLPWTRQVKTDLKSLYTNVTNCSEVLPDPDAQPVAWHNYMCNYHEKFANFSHRDVPIVPVGAVSGETPCGLMPYTCGIYKQSCWSAAIP